MRQPSIFIPHGGGPCFFMEWTMGPADTWKPLERYLRGLIASLPERPTAILSISAHWEEAVPTVQSAANPGMLFDYTGFPPHTYELSWPAPGNPALATRVQQLLGAAGIPSAADPKRNFDHGTFVPMLLVDPDATLPTLQLSLDRSLDPVRHIAIGRALAPLRDEGVLILGSGMSYHNMRGFGRPTTLEISQRFDTWLGQVATSPGKERSLALQSWARAPEGRACHPREEHLLPLLVCAGAAEADPGRVDFNGQAMGAQLSALRFG